MGEQEQEKRTRIRYDPEFVRECLRDVLVKRESMADVARANEMEYYTLAGWVRRAKQYGVERFILCFYRKSELIDMLIAMRTGLPDRRDRP